MCNLSYLLGFVHKFAKRTKPPTLAEGWSWSMNMALEKCLCSVGVKSQLRSLLFNVSIRSMVKWHGELSCNQSTVNLFKTWRPPAGHDLTANLWIWTTACLIRVTVFYLLRETFASDSPCWGRACRIWKASSHQVTGNVSCLLLCEPVFVCNIIAWWRLKISCKNRKSHSVHTIIVAGSMPA